MKSTSNRSTKICEEFNNTNIYMRYKPKKVSIFVTQFSGTRHVLIGFDPPTLVQIFLKGLISLKQIHQA